MNFNFKLNLKVSAFYLEKQKSFIPQKIFFKPYRQDGVSRLNFPEGFGHTYLFILNGHQHDIDNALKLSKIGSKFLLPAFKVLLMKKLEINKTKPTFVTLTKVLRQIN